MSLKLPAEGAARHAAVRSESFCWGIGRLDCLTVDL